ncbi:mitochondrial fission factor homolog A-like isoform X2 [Hirundo rustica]|uniref:mitochondrial fission factor homolog A-like isoform X2 n=1 Tax=Hirundo rustica TaxID=43150 RepID=UPI001A93C0E6|nr:mitochondrial fission factor homolog A-like isoform X2 [Hirundo rustica]
MGRAHYRWAGLITDGPGSLPGGRAVPLRAPPRPGGGRGCLQVGQVASVCGKRHLRTSAKMWPLWGLDLNRVRCDLLFTEAINQRMQVPNRLKVAESCSPGDRRTVAEDVPASFRMHIPDRISLAEIPDTSLRPVLLTQPRKVPSVVVHVSPDPSGDLPFLPSGSRASAQRRKRSGHHSSRSRRDRTPSDCAQLAAPGQHQEGPDSCPLPAPSAPLPLLTEAGRIYSMQNIFHTMYLLGQVLFHRVQDSLQDPALPSSQEPVPAAESASEEAGVTEVAAMRRQLARISGRLRVLEEQSHAWRQKEALVYSVMISACLINTWLWLRR